MKSTQGLTAEYYLGLRYAVSLKELPPEDGGGWVASIPELGNKTFEAVGDTVQEAIDNLEEVRQTLIPMLVDQGVVLPVPQADTERERCSGSLMLRIPPQLHAQLVDYSKRCGVSINKLATQYLAQGVCQSTMLDAFQDSLREVVSEHVRGVGRPESVADVRF